MKRLTLNLSFLTAFLFTQFSCKQEKVKNDLIIQTKAEIGFNVSTPSFRVLNLQSDHQIELSGIPKNWKQLYVKQIPIDEHQYTYQRYHLDQMSIEDFEDYWESHLKFVKDKEFSKSPIKCFVNLAIGKTFNDKLICIIDENNNLDFSDDKAFSPTILNEDTPIKCSQGSKKLNFNISLITIL